MYLISARTCVYLITEMLKIVKIYYSISLTLCEYNNEKNPLLSSFLSICNEKQLLYSSTNISRMFLSVRFDTKTCIDIHV